MPQTRKILILAAAASLAFAGQVFAHAHLKSAEPAPDSIVTVAPTELDLTFTEDLNLKFSGIKVIGPEEAVVKTGDGTLKNDNTTLIVPVTDKLAAGKYTVEWHALSADGHKSKGKYQFTVKP
jgi:methionine-rich copper-binding protein CopC